MTGLKDITKVCVFIGLREILLTCNDWSHRYCLGLCIYWSDKYCKIIHKLVLQILPRRYMIEVSRYCWAICIEWSLAKACVLHFIFYWNAWIIYLLRHYGSFPSEYECVMITHSMASHQSKLYCDCYFLKFTLEIDWPKTLNSITLNYLLFFRNITKSWKSLQQMLRKL